MFILQNAVQEVKKKEEKIYLEKNNKKQLHFFEKTGTINNILRRGNVPWNSTAPIRPSG